MERVGEAMGTPSCHKDPVLCCGMNLLHSGSSAAQTHPLKQILNLQPHFALLCATTHRKHFCSSSSTYKYNSININVFFQYMLLFPSLLFCFVLGFLLGFGWLVGWFCCFCLVFVHVLILGFFCLYM